MNIESLGSVESIPMALHATSFGELLRVRGYPRACATVVCHIHDAIAMIQRSKIAEMFDEIVVQLEAAARHGRMAGGHFRSGEVPRGCAHALALEGHLATARRLLNEVKIIHARHGAP